MLKKPLPILSKMAGAFLGQFLIKVNEGISYQIYYKRLTRR